MTFDVRVKRIYDPPAAEDGLRILVDRLWPRGVNMARAQIAMWLKDIAPSNDLRKWFNHDPRRWEEFKKRYAEELDERSQTVEALLEVVRRSKRITLVYAAKEERFNNAVALREWLLARLESGEVRSHA